MIKANRRKLAKLSVLTLDIEFLLISVIQSVILGFLATESMRLISGFMFEYWLYVATAFIFLLIFWSQAIIHALSFVQWPLDLGHNFLYFLASFFEVVAIHQVGKPFNWFLFISVFLLVAGALYVYDFRLIKKRRPKLLSSPEGTRLYRLMVKEHLLEMRVLLPAGFVYAVLAAILIGSNAEFFLTQNHHLWLIAFQFFFSLMVLLNSIRSFQKRAALIAAVSHA